MTFWTLIRRSLRFHARAHFGVVLGAAIGSAALIGALVVGDSVRESLRERALERLGRIQTALSAGDRLLSADVADRLTRSAQFNRPEVRAFEGGVKTEERIAPVLQLSGILVARGGANRANHVQVLGVDERFWRLASNARRLPELSGDAIILNQPLAKQLGVEPGDEVLVRVSEFRALSRELPISQNEKGHTARRMRVQAISSGAELGNFSLRAGAAVPFDAFVSLRQLQEIASATNQVNLLLSPASFRLVRRPAFPARDLLRSVLWKWLSPALARRIALYAVREVPAAAAAATLQSIMTAEWSLEDAGLQLRVLSQGDVVELNSPRVFLDAGVESAVFGYLRPGPLRKGAWLDFARRAPVATNAQPILTYLANLLTAGTNATPYSMLTAAGAPWTPPDLRDDEILVNQWLGDDLHVKPGDTIEVSYFLPESGASLKEGTNRFRVKAIVPMAMPWADRTLMPDFPGLATAESTHEWDAGFPLVYPIRTKDEAYWKTWRGTPKAFVTLAAGQKLWGNRFGSLTAIRFPVPPKPSSQPVYRAEIEKRILGALRPEAVGLRFEPVREQALKAAAQSQDFGQLFLGFSIFLVVAALLLMALLFQFGLEQRAAEVGTLLALGFTPKQVRRLFLREGAMLALAGGCIGALGGLGYAKAMLWGLATVWRSAVGPSVLQFHATLTTLVIGVCSGTVVAVMTIWLTLRKQAQRPARELLVGDIRNPKSEGRSRGVWVAVGAGVAAGAIVGWALVQGETANAEEFFSAGALVLIAGLGATAAWFGRLGREAGATRLTLGGLGVRGCARRRKRSLATVALLACGAFLIASIGVFRLDANRDATRRDSGTGGFALIGDSTMPVVQDLNTQRGREFFGLGAEQLAGVNVVPFRVRAGDEASCLNLNRAQRPRLLGVRPELLAGRFTFAGVAKGMERREGWELLRTGGAGREARLEGTRIANSQSPRGEEIPAIGDANAIEWAMGKKLGDTMDYTDEQGRTFKLRLVGAVGNSILQGSLLIDEAEFVKRFPGESGYRMFLIDAPSNTVAQVSATLSRALQDVGLELTPAAQRLNEFNAVQNTYLGTFQVLGGLGLLLGSAGLGVVVLRNVLERRGELGLLVAVGFRRRTLQRLVLSEHGVLLGLGLGIGIAAALVAVLPAILAPGTQLPYGSLALTLAAVLLNGLLWTWLATGYALRGNLLAALRNE